MKKARIASLLLAAWICGCAAPGSSASLSQVQLTADSEHTSVPDSFAASSGQESKDRFEALGTISLSSQKPVFAKVIGYRLSDGQWEKFSESLTPSDFTALSVWFLAEKNDRRSLTVYEEFQNTESEQSGSAYEQTDSDCPSDLMFELNPSLDALKADQMVLAVLAADGQKADFSEYDQTFSSLSADGSVIFTLEFEPWTQPEL